MRPSPHSRLAGADLNPVLSDSQTRGTLSLPKRKVVSDGCTKGQRKDPPDKGTVSGAEVGGARPPQSRWPKQSQMSQTQVSSSRTSQGPHTLLLQVVLHLNLGLHLQYHCEEEGSTGSLSPFCDGYTEA